jgi:hypothetical protein
MGTAHSLALLVHNDPLHNRFWNTGWWSSFDSNRSTTRPFKSYSFKYSNVGMSCMGFPRACSCYMGLRHYDMSRIWSRICTQCFPVTISVHVIWRDVDCESLSVYSGRGRSDWFVGHLTMLFKFRHYIERKRKWSQLVNRQEFERYVIMYYPAVPQECLRTSVKSVKLAIPSSLGRVTFRIQI